MNKEKIVYSVWVDGLEMSQEFKNQQIAIDIADDWKRLGFENVDIMSYIVYEV